jgi:uncharacterized membrane protein HdeD (DUF308 family)
VLTSYAIFIGASALLVVWVGRTLFSNGAVFLRDVFDDHDRADAVNRLLLVGFYLINLGFVLLGSSLGVEEGDLADQYQVLTVKLGGVALLLGVVHLMNLSALNRARQRRLMETRRLAAAPQSTGHRAGTYPNAPAAL